MAPLYCMPTDQVTRQGKKQAAGGRRQAACDMWQAASGKRQAASKAGSVAASTHPAPAFLELGVNDNPADPAQLVGTGGIRLSGVCPHPDQQVLGEGLLINHVLQ